MCAAHFWALFQGRWSVYRYVFADLLFCQFWPIRYWKETVYTFSCPALDTLFILKINAFSHFPGSGQDPNLKLTFFFFFFWGCLKAAETSCKHNTDIQTVTFQVDIVSSFFFFFFSISSSCGATLSFKSCHKLSVVQSLVWNVGTSFQATTRGLRN